MLVNMEFVPWSIWDMESSIAGFNDSRKMTKRHDGGRFGDFGRPLYLGSQVGPEADGRVVEEGSHDDLLLADGHYRRLLEHQLPGSFSGALYPRALRAGRLAIVDSYSMFGLCYFVSSTVFVYISVVCVEWFDHRFKSHI